MLIQNRPGVLPQSATAVTGVRLAGTTVVRGAGGNQDSFLMTSSMSRAGAPPLPASPVSPPQFQAVGPHTKIGCNQVLFINNRPPETGDRHRQIENAVAALRALEAGGSEIPAAVPLEFVGDAPLRQMVERGLREGAFRDTTRLAGWLTWSNNFVGFGKELSLPPLELVVAHAESQIDLLIQRIIREKYRPAGVVLSGSPKMLSEVVGKDRVVSETLRLVDFLLKSNIPILGICFGMHLLAWARYQAMVGWMTVPEGCTIGVIRTGRKKEVLVKVQPGARQMTYGSWPIRRRVIPHPITSQDAETRGLEAHSQYVRFPHRNIPRTEVLAFSERQFQPAHDSRSHQRVGDMVTEVLSCGPTAVGIQSHPEFTAELLLALSYMPEFERALAGEGQPLEAIRRGLRHHPHSLSGGELYGSNWVKYILFVEYLKYLLGTTRNENSRRLILKRLNSLREVNTHIAWQGS